MQPPANFKQVPLNVLHLLLSFCGACCIINIHYFCGVKSVEKNGEYTGTVVSLGSGGEGIIKYGDTTVFVPYCLAGESVRFKVLKLNGGIAYGKAMQILTPSYDRVNPLCPVFTKCGGCSLQHMNYAAQLEFKRVSVANALKKIGGINFSVDACVESLKQYNYRNKVAMPVGVDSAGQTVIGFYAERSHRIVPVESCAIQAEWTKKLIDAVKNFMQLERLSGYSPDSGKGEVRHVVGREIKGKYIFAIVCTKPVKLNSLAQELDKRFKNYTLLLNINRQNTNVIFAKEWRICRGEGFFEAEDCGVKFKAGANTFVQVNDDVRTKLYERVVSEAAGYDVALDLYSGGGMLTAMLAKQCKKAYGVEIVEEASRCADGLAVLNGLQDKMINLCGSVEEHIDSVLKQTAGQNRVIVCDPPRKGIDRAVVKKLSSCGAEKIILISCNPATLARDLGILCGTLKEHNGQLLKTELIGEYAEDNAVFGGLNQTADAENTGEKEGFCYEITSITPFDMFPQTPHIETLVVLSKKIPKGISAST